MIVVADLGSFKAYKMDGDHAGSTPRLEPVEAWQSEEAHNKRSNTLTVMEGRSAKAGSDPRTSATASDGEQHNMQLEKRRRSVKQMAATMHDLLRRERTARCFLAAPKEMLHQLMDALDSDVRARIDRALPLDLTKTDKSSLLDHFMAGTANA
jgi:hypothetical protein